MSAGWPMLTAHAVATLTAAWMLSRGEAWWWRTVAQLVRIVSARPSRRRARPAYIAAMTEPAGAGSPTRFTVTLPDGSSRDYFVDPYRLKVLCSLNPDNTLSGVAVRLHGELMTGSVGDAVIELAACWAIVTSLTGYYLFVRGWRFRRAHPPRLLDRLVLRRLRPLRRWLDVTS